MLQRETPEDFVIATGRSVSVREMCEIAFDHAGLVAEDHIVVNASFLRPAEVDFLKGDASKAKRLLGWTPKTSLEDMIREMVDADLRRIRQQMADVQ